ncbi:MAG: protoporphyrinogen/coproporphyrinogen oxidase [Nitrospiria bacterium]
MIKTEYLILGAGLAGLSTAYHLKGEDFQLFEKEGEVGGLCRSYQIRGFTFDLTGHLLHFRQPEIKKWIVDLMGDNLVHHERKAFIYSNQVFTDYPFQANLYGLPKEVIKECLIGFVQALNEKTIKPSTTTKSFEEWIIQSLGVGIGKHFMIPFNEKLWRRPLKEMTADWVSWLVPQPKLENVINGALGISNNPMGYNPSFLYPREGGILSLGNRLVQQLNHVNLNEEVIEIHTQEKEVLFRSGKRVGYEHLISTLPLDICISKCIDLPFNLKEKVEKLEYVSVHVVNLGVEKPHVSDKHWVYFPEPQFSFYRVGFPSNLSPFMAPEGTSSLSIEVSALPRETISRKELLQQVKQGLYKTSILSPEDSVAVEDVRTIPHAYVIYNHDYSKIVPELRSNLEERGIYSIGRYGSWEHTSMEDALSQGKRIAQTLLSQCRK